MEYNNRKVQGVSGAEEQGEQDQYICVYWQGEGEKVGYQPQSSGIHYQDVII